MSAKTLLGAHKFELQIHDVPHNDHPSTTLVRSPNSKQKSTKIV